MSGKDTVREQVASHSSTLLGGEFLEVCVDGNSAVTVGM